MKRIGLIAVAAGLGVALAAAPALAQQNKKVAVRTSPKAKKAKVFTGLRTVGPGRTLRLNVVEVGKKRSPNGVVIRVVDREGKTIRRGRSVLSKKRPAFLQYEVKKSARGGAPSLLRAVFDIECPKVASSYLIATAEVVNVRTGVVESLSSCGRPCGGATYGPPPKDPPGGAAKACIGGDMFTIRD